MIQRLIFAASFVAAFLIADSAEARGRHIADSGPVWNGIRFDMPRIDIFGPPSRPERHARHAGGRTHATARAARYIDAPAREQAPAAAPARIVEHPAGCPSRAFCGCGAAVRVFGHGVRSLWVAANWYRFPRTSPAPGAVAVRRHHVFVLEADLGRGLWLVYDANSGGHATRIHARSISGYTIVDPHGG